MWDSNHSSVCSLSPGSFDVTEEPKCLTRNAMTTSELNTDYKEAVGIIIQKVGPIESEGMAFSF